MWRLSQRAERCVQDLNGLLSSIALSRAGKRENDIVDLVASLKDGGEPAAICAVARCLVEPSERIKTAASRAIHQLLSLVSPEQLTHLDEAVGWRSRGWYISDGWEKLAPENVSALLVDADSQAAVLGLLSFHGNGYVRHEATRLLARETSGKELVYLLIRQNDWVGVIAADAQAAIERRLVPTYLRYFVHCLPLVVHLLAFRRHDLSLVVDKIVDMLVQPQHDAMLAEAIQSSNRLVRRQVARSALEIPGEHHSRVMRHGLRSTDAVVRLVCARQVAKSFSGIELEETATMLQRDPFMPIRREGFLAEVKGHPGAATAIWRRALLDSHASIRELARYSLARVGGFDAASFYRRAYAEEGVSLAVIAGLAECGDQTDLGTVRSFLTDPRASFRLFAVRGIARIAREQAINDLVPSLRDGSPRVVREAKRQLEPFASEVGGEVLFAVLDESHSEHTKKHVVQLILSKGKWQSLPWLIRLASHGDEAIASSARHLVEAWFSPPLCNRVFTRPTAAEREAIKTALGEVRRSANDIFVAKLRGWLESV